MRRSLLIVVALAVLAGGALFVLTRDDGPNAAESAAQRRLTNELKAQLLAPTDLPSVYATLRIDENAKPGKNQGCEGVAGDEGQDSEANAAVAYRNATTGAQLQETLARYKPGRTEALMATARSLASKCASYTQTQGGSEIRFTTTAVQFPTLLEDTVAVRVTGQTSAGAVALDQVFMKKGNLLVVVVHGGLVAPDAALTEDLAKRAAAKIK